MRKGFDAAVKLGKGFTMRTKEGCTNVILIVREACQMGRVVKLDIVILRKWSPIF